MLPLRDLLRELDLRLVAGADGAGRAVRWVHISELVDPTPWLSGGELLLTTGLQLEAADRQREYVARLAGHGLAGLGLGTGFAHAGVPDAMAAAAEEHGFPLFEVPYELPFIAVTEKAFTHLVNEQYALMRRGRTAPERPAPGGSSSCRRRSPRSAPSSASGHARARAGASLPVASGRGGRSPCPSSAPRAPMAKAATTCRR